MSENLKRTPLFDFHQEQGARMVPFAGWEMPVQYSGILQEHRAVRKTAGLFDVSHMGEALVTGADAEAFLDYLVTNKVAGMKVGRAVYSCMCLPDGGVVDDLIIYRLEEQTFLICLNASNAEKDIAWMNEQKSGYTCTVEDVSAAYGQLALQGPNAWKILEAVAGAPEGTAFALKKFGLTETQLVNAPVIVARTGYTGEDGCEIFCPADELRALAEVIVDKGQAHGLALVGLGARDSLRLEAGLPLYGHELSETINPVEAGFGWTVKPEGRNFIARDVLAKELADGPGRSVVHFFVEDRRIPREGATVMAGDDEAGRVLSGTMSPILEKPIGSAIVQREFLGQPLEAAVRKKRLPLSVEKPPLHLNAAS